MPGARGFLGSTIGIAGDKTFVALARVVDEAAAKANSTRPEQRALWADTAMCFDGEPSWRESNDVTTLFGGGSDSAGFVQIIEGTTSDRAKAESLETPEMLRQLRVARPDLLGSLHVGSTAARSSKPPTSRTRRTRVKERRQRSSRVPTGNTWTSSAT